MCSDKSTWHDFKLYLEMLPNRPKWGYHSAYIKKIVKLWYIIIHIAQYLFEGSVRKPLMNSKFFIHTNARDIIFTYIIWLADRKDMYYSGPFTVCFYLHNDPKSSSDTGNFNLFKVQPDAFVQLVTLIYTMINMDYVTASAGSISLQSILSNQSGLFAPKGELIHSFQLYRVMQKRTNFWNIAISTFYAQKSCKFRIQYQNMFLAIWQKLNWFGTKLIELCCYF